MKITLTICDRCDRGHDDGVFVTSYRINRGKEMDASGNGYNIDWEYIDLCTDCYKDKTKEHPELKIQKS